jgi:hypothetical protein
MKIFIKSILLLSFIICAFSFNATHYNVTVLINQFTGNNNNTANPN